MTLRSEVLLSDRFFALLAGLIFLCVLVLEVLRPYLYLAPDSFTYFTMARQAWDAHILYSYSGIDHTTGIHPGFYFLLLPLYPLFGLAIPQWSLVLGMGLVVGGVYALYRSAGPVLALVLFLLALTSFGVALTNNGMESSLLFFALCLLAWFFFSEKRAPFLLGALISLAVFARLDTIFLAMALYAVLFFSGWKVRDLFRTSIPLGALLALVLFLDLHYGGTLLPLSGKLKSSFPIISSHWLDTLISLKLFAVSLAVSGAYLVRGFVQRRPLDVFVLSLFLATLASCLYNSLFVSDIGAWYGTMPFFLLALVAGLLAKETVDVSRGRLKNWYAPALIIFGTLIVWSHATLPGEDWISPHQSAASFLGAHARPGEAAGELKDGVFAFYSSMPVYNLTGLGNNQKYIDSLRSGDTESYFEAHSIRYIVGGDFGSGVQVPGSRVDFKTCAHPLYDTGIVRIFKSTDCRAP